MGMSASQVRFLSLQHRKHDVGRQLTALSNRKQALSRDMNEVSKHYTEALNKNVLKWSNDSGMTYQNLTYDLMMKPNDYNTERPFIISTKDGKAVLDTVSNLIGKRDGEYVELTGATFQNGPMAGEEINYTNIAKWITTAENLEGKTGHLYTTTEGFEAGTKNINSYIIPNKAPDYGFEHTLRYQIFQEIGLVDEQTTRDYNSLLEQLYGTQSAKEFGNYGELLSKFDYDKTADLLGDGTTYDQIFGRLNFDSGDGFFFNPDDGCALGNLALAKAYKKEYEAYLETPIDHDILVDAKERLCETTITDTNWLDKSHGSYYNEYNFNEENQDGIAFRIIDLLSVAEGTDRIVYEGGMYKLKTDGILNNLKFYNSTDGAETASLWNAIGQGAYLGDFCYDADNQGQFDNDADLTGVVTTWAQVFDYNSKYDSNSSSDNAGSYDTSAYADVNGHDYFKGSDYINNHSNNVTGLVLLSNNHMDDGADLGDDVNLCHFKQIVDSFANSFATIDNVNTQAVTYAMTEVIKLYQTARDTNEESDGSYTRSKTMDRAGSVCDDIFGLGWCNKFGSNSDGVAISLPNIMNAFMTLYQMYDRVGGDTSRITSGAATTIKRSITNASATFDGNIQTELNAGHQPLVALFHNWKQGATITSPTSMPGAGNPTTITFEKVYSAYDDAGNPITEKGKIEVTGNWNGTDFTSVSSYKVYDYGTNKLLEKYTYDDTNKKVKQETYTFTQTGSYYHFATVDYEANHNAKISLHGGTAYSEGVRNIYMKGATSSFGIESIDIGTTNYLPSTLPDSFKESSSSYMVSDPQNSSLQDEKNKYELILKSPGDSTFTSIIELKPVNKYGSMLDDLVDACQRRVDELQDRLENFFSGKESKLMDYYDAIFLRVSESGWVSDPSISGGSNSQTYVNNKLQNNDYFVAECKAKVKGGGYTYTNKQAVNIMKIFQVRDEDAENIALATYESEKSAIAVKERAVDARMQKLETEQEVINTELESIKKVKQDNIDRFFKIFA